MKSFSRHLLQLLLGAIILHALWLAGYLLIRSEILPAPWAVYAHMAHLNGSDLLAHTLTSLQRIGWGILIATILSAILSPLDDPLSTSGDASYRPSSTSPTPYLS